MASRGLRIVYNKLLGGWYIVRGPHQTPLNGRFNSKAEAQEWLNRSPQQRANPDVHIDIGSHNVGRGKYRWTETRKNPSGTGKLYVGFYHGKGEVFRATRTPTDASHGNRFNYVVGPFRTLGAAQIMAGTHGPQIITVADAERFARQQGLSVKK